MLQSPLIEAVCPWQLSDDFRWTAQTVLLMTSNLPQPCSILANRMITEVRCNQLLTGNSAIDFREVILETSGWSPELSTDTSGEKYRKRRDGRLVAIALGTKSGPQLQEPLWQAESSSWLLCSSY
jgi:hypothetical protein